MRLRPLFVLPFLLFPLAAAAVEAKPLSCTVQPAAAETPADTAYKSGSVAAAETAAMAQMGTTPTVASYAALVRVQLERDELTAAMATARASVAAHPASAAAQALLGDAQLRGGDIAAASGTYVAALKLDPCSPRAHLGNGRINNMVGRNTLGNAELKNAHVLAPQDGEITLYWLDSLTGAQHGPERGSALRALLDSSPVLPAETVEHVRDELALIEQQALCTPVESPATAKLDLSPLMLNGNFARSWGMQVRLNEKSTSLLELDSSVAGIVLNPKDAEKAGVRPLTAASATRPYVAVADHLRIGKLEYRGCPVRVVPAAMLANSNSLIGTEFFKDHLIHLDYVDKSMTLRPLPTLTPGGKEPLIAPEEKDWSPVYVSGPNVLVPTMLDKKGPFLFLLDTGSEVTVFSPAVLPQTLGKHRELTRNLRGTSGAIIKVLADAEDPIGDHTLITAPDGSVLKVYTPANTPVMRFTNNVRNDIDSIAFDISPKSHTAGVNISGIFGFDSFLYDFSIDINYRDSLAQILLDQNHRYRQRENNRLF